MYKELPVGSSTVGKFVTYVETQDSDEAGDYYKWTWKHFSTRIYCAQTVIEFGDATPIKYRCCGPCWSIDQCESCINILSDQLVNGRKFSRFLLDIPYDSKEPYYLAVQQSSLSAGAFKFWESLNGQVNNGGGVFNSPPAAVAGNLSNVNNKDEQVLGYFGASAIAKKIIYISRDKIEKPPIPPVANFTISPNCFACKEGYFRTPHKPEGWID